MPDSINLRTSRSGDTRFAEPVELHDSSKLRIEFIPFFIDRSDQTQMACKIVRHDKQSSWERTAISLQEPALRKLVDALAKHLAVSGNGDGSYVVLRADGSIADGSDLSRHDIARAIEELLATDGMSEHLANLDLGAELAHALRSDLRLRELRDAVAELTNHLQEGTSSESVYQSWCERHSWSFGSAYVVNDTLRSISATDQIDLLLPRHLGGFRDLIELKRPDMPILVRDNSHKNWHWSADVSKAIGQCHRYMDVLHDEVGLTGLRDAPEVVAYHPRATIVIGRSDEWSADKQQALHGLNRRLADISVISYDHLLAQARRTLELFEVSESETDVTLPQPAAWDPDDEPF